MANNALSVDRVFHALSDQTRRAIVMRLSARPSAVGDLFTPMPMALPTLLKHVRVLEQCGLVTTKRSGANGFAKCSQGRCARPMPGSRNNDLFWRQG